MTYVFDFDDELSEPDRLSPSKYDRQLYGGKGSFLASMRHFGFPVPPGFVISTEAFRDILAQDALWPALKEEVLEQLQRTSVAAQEDLHRSPIGNPLAGDAPNLFSVRSGATVSMPGMLDTVLDLGMPGNPTPEDLSGVSDFLLDCQLRFIESFARRVLRMDSDVFRNERSKLSKGWPPDARFTGGSAIDLIMAYQRAIRRVGKSIPDDPTEQIEAAVVAVARSWTNERARAFLHREGIREADQSMGITVQAMVYGNRDADSGSGVAYSRDPVTGTSRDPVTGTPRIVGDYLSERQGIDVVGGETSSSKLDEMPEGARTELEQYLGVLESRLRDACETEFTVESGKTWLLQCRAARRAGLAAFRIAWELTQSEPQVITMREAIRRLTPRQALGASVGELPVALEKEALVIADPVAPGVAAGRVFFDPVRAQEALASGGTPRSEGVIFVTKHTTSDDHDTIADVDGVATINAGIASHSMVLAREWNTPYIAGVPGEIIERKKSKYLVLLADDGDGGESGYRHIKEGDVITIDGVSGRLYRRNMLPYLAKPTSVPPLRHLNRILEKADKVAIGGDFHVRINADLLVDAQPSLEDFPDAEGIGLIRTEGLVRRRPGGSQIMKQLGESGWIAALPALEETIREELVQFLSARELRGKAVMVRLLDHLVTDEPLSALLRGVRIGMLRPGIYKAQLRAFFRAVAEVGRSDQPVLQIMVPFIIDLAEFVAVRDWAASAYREVYDDGWKDQFPDNWSYQVGCMIETPRAALDAGRLCASADFLSFGLNDLTELVFGFSKSEGEVISHYLREGVINENPALVIDKVGTEELLELSRQAIEDASQANDGGIGHTCELSTASEHAHNAESVMVLRGLRFKHISVPPQELPVARLLAAQAVLGGAVTPATHPELWG